MHQWACQRRVGHPGQIAIRNQEQRPWSAWMRLVRATGGQLQARTMRPPVVLPAAAGSIANFDRGAAGIV